MLTYNNFTASIPLANFSAENRETLVRDGVNPKQNNFDTHWGTTHILKSYIDQVVMNRLLSLSQYSYSYSFSFLLIM